MFRLFVFRIIRGEHPFKADRNHIHHLILDKLGLTLAFSIIQGFIIVNFSLYYFLQNKNFEYFFCCFIIFVITINL